MAAPKRSARKSTASKKTGSSKKKKRAKKSARRSTASRKRLTVSREKRGPKAPEIPLALDAPEVAPLVASIRESEGVPIGAYHEPLSGRPVVLATLPIAAVQPTPYQRDLSPTHTKRLAKKIEESGSFLDPLVVVKGRDGRWWTPNGRHRLAAAKVLSLHHVTALVSPDETLAFRILALNTEKAHNLKDRSLEVIRMARELAALKKRAKESDFAAEFESPELLTLGIVYEKEGRFAGGAYSPFLRKVDRFSDRSLAVSLREREGFASRILEIDFEVKRIIDALRSRGFKSPYLRNYVVARINPVRFHRARRGDTTPPMAIGAALTRMHAAAGRFDVSKVKESDLALVAAVAGGD